VDFEKLKQEKFSFIHITTKDCNVCKVLKSKLINLADKFEKSTFHSISLDDHEDAAGFFMAFTIPTFLVYSKGRELIRTGRNLNVDEIYTKLNRYHQMIIDENER